MVSHLTLIHHHSSDQSAIEVSLVELNPTMPTSRFIVVTALFSDPDGDLVTVEYLWTINGVAQSETSNMLSVHLSPGSDRRWRPLDGVI